MSHLLTISPKATIHPSATLEPPAAGEDEILIVDAARIGNATIEGPSWVCEGAQVEDLVRAHSAYIGCDAFVGKGTRLEAGSAIGARSKTGSDCVLGMFTSLGEGCELGERSVIGICTHIKDNVVIGPDCKIGDWCTVGVGARVLAGTTVPEKTAIEDGRTVGPADFTSVEAGDASAPAWFRLCIRAYRSARSFLQG